MQLKSLGKMKPRGRRQHVRAGRRFSERLPACGDGGAGQTPRQQAGAEERTFEGAEAVNAAAHHRRAANDRVRYTRMTSFRMKCGSSVKVGRNGPGMQRCGEGSRPGWGRPLDGGGILSRLAGTLLVRNGFPRRAARGRLGTLLRRYTAA